MWESSETPHHSLAMWAINGLMLIVQVLLLQQRPAKTSERTSERHEQHTMMQLLLAAVESLCWMHLNRFSRSSRCKPLKISCFGMRFRAKVPRKFRESSAKAQGYLAWDPDGPRGLPVCKSQKQSQSTAPSPRPNTMYKTNMLADLCWQPSTFVLGFVVFVSIATVSDTSTIP